MDQYEFFVLPVNQVLPFDVTQHYPTEINGVKMENYLAWMKSAYYISAWEIRPRRCHAHTRRADCLLEYRLWGGITTIGACCKWRLPSSRRGIWTSDGLRQPVHHSPLDGDARRRRSPSRDILIQHAAQQVGSCPYWISRSENVAKKTAVLRSRVPDHVDQAIDGFLRQSCFGQCGMKDALHFEGRCLRRDRTSVHFFQVRGGYFYNALGESTELFR